MGEEEQMVLKIKLNALRKEIETVRLKMKNSSLWKWILNCFFLLYFIEESSIKQINIRVFHNLVLPLPYFSSSNYFGSSLIRKGIYLPVSSPSLSFFSYISTSFVSSCSSEPEKEQPIIFTILMNRKVAGGRQIARRASAKNGRWIGEEV